MALRYLRPLESMIRRRSHLELWLLPVRGPRHGVGRPVKPRSRQRSATPDAPVRPATPYAPVQSVARLCSSSKTVSLAVVTDKRRRAMDANADDWVLGGLVSKGYLSRYYSYVD